MDWMFYFFTWNQHWKGSPSNLQNKDPWRWALVLEKLVLCKMIGGESVTGGQKLMSCCRGGTWLLGQWEKKHIFKKCILPIADSFFFYLFSDNRYNIPICVWLLDTHPHCAPIVYVKPTPNMQIRPGRHVDPNGKINLPFLLQWKYVSFI